MKETKMTCTCKKCRFSSDYYQFIGSGAKKKGYNGTLSQRIEALVDDRRIQENKLRGLYVCKLTPEEIDKIEVLCPKCGSNKLKIEVEQDIYTFFSNQEKMTITCVIIIIVCIVLAVAYRFG